MYKTPFGNFRSFDYAKQFIFSIVVLPCFSARTFSVYISQILASFIPVSTINFPNVINDDSSSGSSSLEGQILGCAKDGHASTILLSV